MEIIENKGQQITAEFTIIVNLVYWYKQQEESFVHKSNEKIHNVLSRNNMFSTFNQ